MIANVTMPASDSENAINTILQQENTIQNLQRVQSGQFLLENNLLASLRDIVGFNEVRIECTKQWHNRKFHVVLYGDKVMKNLFEKIDFTGYCGNIRFLSDDTSEWVNDCSTLKGGASGIGDLYGAIVWKTHIFATWLVTTGNNVQKKYCNDWHAQQPDFTSEGHWSYYVR